jgi:type I restriction enzyme S subunit
MTLRLHPDEIVAESSSPVLQVAPWWERVRLGEIADVINGAAFKSSLFNNDERGVPLVRIRDVGGNHAQVHYDGPYDERHVIKGGDLLVGMDGDFRAARWGGTRALLNQRVCRVDVTDRNLYSQQFLLFVLQPYLNAVHAVTSSVTVKHLSSRTVQDLPIPLPSRAEQERIVAAIEEHLSRLDAAEHAVGSASARLRQMAAKVKEAVLSDAPPVALADVALESRYGTSVKCDYVSSGPGVIRIPNIVDERVIPRDLKYATDPSAVSPDVLLRDGDVVFVRTNGSRDLIGRAAVAADEAVGLGFASYLIRYRFRAELDPHYLCAVVSAPSTRRALESLAATTAGQYNLSVSKLDGLVIPLPSLDEQQRLVDARSERITGIWRLADGLYAAERRAASLRRSILAAAFSGQLVPQDPDDEPASVLLARIRAERAAATPTKRTRQARAS